MRLLALPQLHHKHGVRVVVVHSNLVSKAADLPERLATPSQITHQFVTLTWDCAKRSHIRKGHGPTLVGHSDTHTARKPVRFEESGQVCCLTTLTRYVEVRRRFLREHPGHALDGWPLPAD